MNLPKFKDYTGQPVNYIQRKMDGHMYHIYKDKVGSVRCITKNNKDKTDKMLAIEGIKKQIDGLPYATHLMVELHCPGEPATEVARGIAHADQRLKIAVFACPTLCGVDLYNTDLRVVQKNVEVYGLDFVPVKPAMPTDRTPEGIEFLLGMANTMGIEGWVLKESHMEGWYKLKPVKTLDAFVVDVTESDSDTYRGYMKAVKLGLYEPELGGDLITHDLGECGGGFTKRFKKSDNFRDMKARLIGRVCEVAYQSITAHKKLQFPRFIRWREDKDAYECTTEQLI